MLSLSKHGEGCFSSLLNNRKGWRGTVSNASRCSRQRPCAAGRTRSRMHDPIMLNISSAIPYVVLAATAGALWLAGYLWQQRRRPGGHLFNVMPAVRSLLFRQHHDGVVVLDLDFHVLDVNAAAERLLDRHDIRQGAPAAGVLSFWEQARERVQAGDGRSIELEFAATVIEVRALRIHDQRQRTIGRLIVLHDVTERARLIRELHAYARTVAHDLKNPLSSAVGYIDLVRIAEPHLHEESARRLDAAEQICQHMAGIIDDLLRRPPVRARR